MQVSATVMVYGDGDAKPEPHQLEKAAKILRENGFDVLRVGRFGVSITGNTEDFARVLGVAPTPGVSMSAPANPNEPSLRELVKSVEVVSKPEMF